MRGAFSPLSHSVQDGKCPIPQNRRLGWKECLLGHVAIVQGRLDSNQQRAGLEEILDNNSSL